MKAPQPEVTETRPDVSYTSEGGGIVATCQACWWGVWKPDRRAAEAAAGDHKKCRTEDLTFVHRRRQARQRGSR